jgi:hypothetical protein
VNVRSGVAEMQSETDHPVTIYALSDRRFPTCIRYVGKTIKPLHRRLCEHVAKRDKEKNHKNNWIKKLLSEGSIPIIWPLEVCSLEAWKERERHWISFFKPIGIITNCSEGGDGGGTKGYKWTPEQLERISKIRRGKAASTAQRAHLEKMWRRKRSQAEIEHILKIGLKSRLTSERSRELGKLRFGKKLKISPERRAQLQAQAKKYLKWPAGKPRPIKSVETRAKLSAAFKGRKAPWAIRSELNKQITLPKLRACNELKKKPVISDDGQEYGCVGDACSVLKCSTSSFREAMKKGWKCRGVKWKFKERENHVTAI